MKGHGLTAKYGADWEFEEQRNGVVLEVRVKCLLCLSY